jgi:hypothetical protein
VVDGGLVVVGLTDVVVTGAAVVVVVAGAWVVVTTGVAVVDVATVVVDLAGSEVVDVLPCAGSGFPVPVPQATRASAARTMTMRRIAVPFSKMTCRH